MASKQELFDRMVEVAMTSPGELDEAARRAIVSRAQDRVAEVPSGFETLVDNVAWHAYKVTDADVERLKDSRSEDAIFEAMVAAAVGAAQLRASRALAVMRGGA